MVCTVQALEQSKPRSAQRIALCSLLSHILTSAVPASAADVTADSHVAPHAAQLRQVVASKQELSAPCACAALAVSGLLALDPKVPGLKSGKRVFKAVRQVSCIASSHIEHRLACEWLAFSGVVLLRALLCLLRLALRARMHDCPRSSVHCCRMRPYRWHPCACVR